MIDELRFYSEKYDFTLLGYVIMPDHVHLLLWWDSESKPELSISKIMQALKGATARRIIDYMKKKGSEQMLRPARKENNSKSHKSNLKYRFWQPRFFDFNIYSEDKLLEKLDYIHTNPVKAGLANSPEDYKWSSYEEYLKGEGALL